MSKIEALRIWFFKIVEEDMEDDIAKADIGASVVIIVACVPIMLYFYLHQTWSTGFFTAKFGTVELLFLYGILLYWIVTSLLILVGRKHLSRNLDSFGGLIFATIGIAWLFMFFPFEFTYFPDVSPDFLRFLVRWISNGIARVLLVLLFIVHLAFAILAGIQRVYVRKAMIQLKNKSNSQDLS